MSAGWPEDSDPAVSDPGDFTGPSAAAGPDAGRSPSTLARYGSPTEVGRGGMGRVDRVRDGVLGRDVARKTLLHPSPPLVERLRREARLCARLDHPGIVPVHDFHDDGTGSPWYTMRLVRGLTLGDSVQRLDGLGARLRLVPRVLAAAQAVAHAHDRGIIHRDIKPANILLGPHGETLVVDWGLARALDEPEEELPEHTPLDPQLTQLGAVIGTPAWMSPEQGRGEPAGRASDVYALGRLLRWLLDVPGATVPRDLRAIVDKASADHPALRYSDAGAFALELEDWLAGRPVSAHDYSARELAARFVRTFRLPLLVGTVALVVLTSGLSVAFRRASQDRDRALLAEEGLRAALATERAQGAAIALRAGDPRRGEALALDALALSPSPPARGLLAASRAGATVTRRVVLACGNARLGPDGASAICEEDGAVRWRSLPDGAERARLDFADLPGRGDAAALTPEGPLVALAGGHLVRAAPGGVALRSGVGEYPRASFAPTPVGLDLAIVDQQELWLRSGDAAQRERCDGDEAALALTTRGEEWLLACSGGTVRVGRGLGPGRPQFRVANARLSAIAVVGDRLALGTLDGELLVVAGATGEVLLPLRRVSAAPIRAIAVSASQSQLVVAAETGPVGLFAATSLALLASLPDALRSPRFLPDGRLRGAEGDEVVEYGFAAVRPLLVPGAAGLSALAWSADGRLAMGDGSGDVSVFATDGTTLHSVHWPSGVIKDLAFDAAGALWSSGVEPGSVRVSRGPDYATEVVVSDSGARRLAPLADGSLLFATWRPCLNRRFPDGRIVQELPGETHDLALDAGARTVLVAGELGGPTLWSLDAPPRSLGDATPGARVALNPSGHFAVLAGPTLRIIDVQGASPTVVVPLPPDSTAVAASEDTAIVGFLDGAVRFYALRDGVLLGEAHLHDGRVSDVIVAGSRAFTASWDATARAGGSSPRCDSSTRTRGRPRPALRALRSPVPPVRIPPMRAYVLLRTPDGQKVALGAGDIIGRAWSASLHVDDARISEAHALVSLRADSLRLLALRGRFAVGGRVLSELDLSVGQRIELAPGMAMEVLDVVLPDVVVALQSEGMAPLIVPGAAALLLQPEPSLVHPMADGARAWIWPHGEGFRLRLVEQPPRDLPLGESFEVDGRRFVLGTTPRQAPAPTVERSALVTPLRIVARYETVHLHRRDRSPVVVDGVQARLLSELVAFAVPVAWRTLAEVLWPEVDDPLLLRKRLDGALARLRSTLVDGGVRSDLVRSNGQGQFELFLETGDAVEDQL